ncbi:MAG: hypothetical protein V4772_00515 [Pseudomonadota bacterium]
MFDGKRDTPEVLKATAGMGVTAEDVSYLVTMGLLAPIQGRAVPAAVTTPMPAVTAAPQAGAVLSHTADGHPTANAQARYSKAYPVATRLTAALGLRGFRLNLAVEAAGDLDKLKELAPKIREAVGAEKFLELENALYY